MERCVRYSKQENFCVYYTKREIQRLKKKKKSKVGKGNAMEK